MKLLLLGAMFLLSASVFYAQSESVKTQSIFPSDEKYLSQIQEVYGQDIITSDPRLTGLLVRLLRDRISIITEEPVEGKDYPLLSSLPAMNNTNPAIVPFVAGQFTSATFNPIRYEFNFFDKKDQWFRIDGTNRVLFINHFNAKEL